MEELNGEVHPPQVQDKAVFLVILRGPVPYQHAGDLLMQGAEYSLQNLLKARGIISIDLVIEDIDVPVNHRGEGRPGLSPRWPGCLGHGGLSFKDPIEDRTQIPNREPERQHTIRRRQRRPPGGMMRRRGIFREEKVVDGFPTKDQNRRDDPLPYVRVGQEVVEKGDQIVTDDDEPDPLKMRGFLSKESDQLIDVFFNFIRFFI
jgi:hypothetical protein